MHNTSTVAILLPLTIRWGEMNEQIHSAYGNNWSYDSAVGIITILGATGRIVDQGWSICNNLEPARSDQSTKLAEFVELHGEKARQIPCDAMAAVRLFLAGVLTLEHLEKANERGRRIECHAVKIGPHERTIVILPL